MRNPWTPSPGRRGALPALLLALGTLALAGCPETGPTGPGGPEAGGGPGAAPTPGAGEPAANQPGSAPVAGEAAASGGGAAGVFGDDLPEAELEPEFTQDQLAGKGVKVSGELVCEGCAGKLLVRVLPPPPDEAGGGEGELRLITSRSFDAPGAFEILVPADEKSVVLQVVDDANSDGRPSPGERMGMPVDGPVKVDGPVSGIRLEVGKFPEAPAVDPMGNTLAPEGAATPGAPSPAADAPATQPGTLATQPGTPAAQPGSPATE